MLGVFVEDSDSSRSQDTDQPHTLLSRIDRFANKTPIGIPGGRQNGHASTAPGSLHSSNSLCSVNSCLEISASPTLLFNTGSGHCTPPSSKHDTTSPSVQPSGCGDALVPREMDDEAEFVIHPVEGTVNACFPSSGTGQQMLLHAKSCDHYPVECTDVAESKPMTAVSETEPGQALKPEVTAVFLPSSDPVPENSSLTRLQVEGAMPPKETGDRGATQSTPCLPIEDASTPKETEVEQPPSSSNFNLPSTEPESKFFSFVILHVKSDEDLASRVQENLENVGIAGGTTFCDGFSLPGCSPLDCLDDAVDNSAFTILLLTQNWISHWANFQTNVALMNAIDLKHKFNTVIPFLPRGDQLPKRKMPLHLRTLIPLDESSLNFDKTVKNTFTQERIRAQKDIWRKEEEIKILQRKAEELVVAADQAKRKKDAEEDLMTARQISQPTTSVTTSAPGEVSLPHPGVSSGTQYAPEGRHTVIHIQHTRNVQIGDQNQMRIVRAEEEGESTEEDSV